MQIIKRGEKPENDPWQATCGGCWTVFRYEPSDVQRHSTGSLVNSGMDHGEKEWVFSDVYNYINCPVCSKQIRLIPVSDVKYYTES